MGAGNGITRTIGCLIVMSPDASRVPQTMAARRARIIELLEATQVTSQSQLSDLLADEGFNVTQATLSRDLEALGAVKDSSTAGGSRYVLRDAAVVTRLQPSTDALGRIAADVLVSAEPAQNIAVLRTPPGAAQYLAGCLDRFGDDGIVGTVAGDDTVLVVLRTTGDAKALCTRLLALASGRSPHLRRHS